MLYYAYKLYICNIIVQKSDVTLKITIYSCPDNTINPRGGCQVSGYNCEDQEFEMQCYYNQKLGLCAWVNGKCMNRSCETAPKSIRTDEACQEYFEGCTLIAEGGCRQRTQCNDVTIKESLLMVLYVFGMKESVTLKYN